MFQLAACYALARRIGAEYRVDLSSFRHSIRRYELDVFAGAPQAATVSELPLGSRLGRWGVPAMIAIPVGRSLGTTAIFEERSPFLFDERFLHLRDNSYLIGYFQSQKYFEGLALEIRKLFTFGRPPSAANRNMLERIAECPSVSIHVRRGDYVSVPKTSKYYRTCSLEYYQAALRIIRERVSDPTVFVFSDDPGWARENIKLADETIYVDHNDGPSAFEDMRLMSNCRHHIIANSSFSWWGAWLNPSTEKTVVAPRQWLSDSAIDLRDLLPPEWTSI